MTIYIIDLDEDVVEAVQLPDDRYTHEDLIEDYGEYWNTYREAKYALDEYVKEGV